MIKEHSLWIVICPDAVIDHALEKRMYAHTLHYPHSICIAPDFLSLPAEYRVGILLHELGHLLTLSHNGIAHPEELADREIKDRFHISIRYKNSRWGESLQYVEGPERIRGGKIIQRFIRVWEPVCPMPK